MDKELQKRFDNGAKIKDMVNTPGWKDIVLPSLKKRREKLYDNFLLAKEHLDMIGIQQAIIAIDVLLNEIRNQTMFGEQALEEYQKELNAEHP